MDSPFDDIRHNAYFERVPVGEGNHVNFIHQCMEQIYSSSFLRGTACSHNYGANKAENEIHILQETILCSFFFVTGRPWWAKTPSRAIDYMPQNNTDVVSQDYIDIRFDETVFPIRVSIYEQSNPGSIIRIWAQDSENRWFLLWNGPPQIVSSTSRIFSPPLQPCNFSTNMVRLEFNHSLLNRYTELRCVLLTGTETLIIPKDQSRKQNLTSLLKSFNNKYPCHEDIHNLTPDYDSCVYNFINAHSQSDINHLKRTLNKYCIMCQSDVVANFHESKPASQLGLPQEASNSMQDFLSEKLPTLKDVSLDESKKLSRGSFSEFPDEIMIIILSYLDFKSLCRLNRVNKHFNNLTQDPLLYTSLNLKPYWHIINAEALCYLAPRCKYLRRLDLSWCNGFSVSDFEKFLDTCGSLLTHLRLNCCSHIDDSTMFKISKICKNMKELGLHRCDWIKDKGFSYLENLEFLERLDLRSTHIKTQTLCNILQRNPRMRHLHVGRVSGLDVHVVAMVLKNSCPDLESIDSWGIYITPSGIDALADCKNLREVTFSVWRNDDIGDSLHRLLSSCQYLEKILTDCENLTERDLRALQKIKTVRLVKHGDNFIDN